MKLPFLLIKKKFTCKSPTWKRKRKDFARGFQARLVPPKKLRKMHQQGPKFNPPP
jgi:hypothetical protein